MNESQFLILKHDIFAAVLTLGFILVIVTITFMSLLEMAENNIKAAIRESEERVKRDS